MSWRERTQMLVKDAGVEALERANVLVVGLGGVGAYAAEMVARAGVGRMTVADADTVSASNINRQLVALHSTVGRSKADVLAERLRDINPALKLTAVNEFLSGERMEGIVAGGGFDYVIDAIDTLTPKIELIMASLKHNVPIVSSMGAGSKVDPTLIEVSDISKSHHCPLAHMLRKRLHKIGVRTGFKVVFSSEQPIEGTMFLCNEQNKKSNVGTISYMPPVFGCACASVCLRDILGL
ncbi:MAG: tRNA threonylcarbamoyladenosine dehydratase [Rikenellaceae bacterium]|nr:tRNA threonylcarbamoyladenosine dehydratase [Rikenellaceae bacterium]MDE7134052.1 tRNA threonylcarbamoyladenosine dehydratase [Rikenellaceae bacterium]MDE7356657.1 tRNA threonylcarbamoyladenosine dehydratase [Rikenellaceae bacterium]